MSVSQPSLQSLCSSAPFGVNTNIFKNAINISGANTDITCNLSNRVNANAKMTIFIGTNDHELNRYMMHNHNNDVTVPLLTIPDRQIVVFRKTHEDDGVGKMLIRHTDTEYQIELAIVSVIKALNTYFCNESEVHIIETDWKMRTLINDAIASIRVSTNNMKHFVTAEPIVLPALLVEDTEDPEDVKKIK